MPCILCNTFYWLPNMYITLCTYSNVHAWWLNSEIIRLRPKHLWALLCYIANETKYMHLIILTYTIINVHLSKLSLEEGFPDSWLPLLPGIFYITCPLYPDYRLFWCIWPFVYCSASWVFAMIKLLKDAESSNNRIKIDHRKWRK